MRCLIHELVDRVVVLHNIMISVCEYTPPGGGIYVLYLVPYIYPLGGYHGDMCMIMQSTCVHRMRMRPPPIGGSVTGGVVSYRMGGGCVISLSYLTVYAPVWALCLWVGTWDMPSDPWM